MPESLIHAAPAAHQAHARGSGRGVKLGAIEWFLAAQLLSTALLFIPGSQAYRLYIRALPYVLSVAFLLLPTTTRARSLHPSWPWVLLALGILVTQIFHPNSATAAAFAQLAFQCTICISLLWASRHGLSPQRMASLLWWFLMFSLLSTVFGALQVYWPSQFTPQFSTLLEEGYLNSLSYVAADGQRLFRPPGLTDKPGGAAHAAVMSAFLGLVFIAHRKAVADPRWVFCLASSVAGLFVLYLTQVRSYFVMLLAGILAAAVIHVRRSEFRKATVLIGLCALAVSAAFVWAVAIGGDAVERRFRNLLDKGLVETAVDSRGRFLEQALTEYLVDYPLGAGLGRWGMMSTYFGGASRSTKLHAEIQLEGWIFDGGIPLCLAWFAAIGVAMASTYHISVKCRDGSLAHAALVVFCLDIFVVGQSFAGPTFNTQSGIVFWFLNGLVYSCWRNLSQSQLDHPRRGRPEREVSSAKIPRRQGAPQPQPASPDRLGRRPRRAALPPAR